MLLSANHLIGFNVEAIDGKIGDVYDVYFDAKKWIIRYIVVDTGKFLPGKRVLLNPASFKSPQTNDKILPVNLTGDKVKSSPDASTELPVSKLEEIELHKHYDWVPYWDNDFITYSMPVVNPNLIDEESSKQLQQKIKNNHQSRRLLKRQDVLFGSTTAIISCYCQRHQLFWLNHKRF